MMGPGFPLGVSISLNTWENRNSSFLLLRLLPNSDGHNFPITDITSFDTNLNQDSRIRSDFK